MSRDSGPACTADLAALEKVTPPAAVVFDCDGTLMDTEPCADAARSAVFARRGRVYDDAARESLVGLSVAQGGEVMSRLFGGSPSRLAEELADELLTAVADGAQPMPGAADLVTRLAARVPVAVASNGPRVLLDKSLAHGGLSRWLPITVSGDDVASPSRTPPATSPPARHSASDPAAPWLSKIRRSAPVPPMPPG